MSVFNLGSINVDNVYRVPHIPGPGETLAATAFTRGLGGKGANMSVAVARAAARAIHIGAVGSDGGWCVERLMEYGVDTRHIATVASGQTGHANIAVADDGENQIVTFGGANQQISDAMIGSALAEAGPGDTLLIQNETNGQVKAAQMARDLGLRVVYAAAPFEAKTVSDIAEYADYLVLNAVEAEQLRTALGVELTARVIGHVVVTMCSEGSGGIDVASGSYVLIPALPVTPVDTTGAGDTFTGYLVAGLDRGMPMEQALRLATQAGALMVTRHGTADVIPDLKDIEDARLG